MGKHYKHDIEKPKKSREGDNFLLGYFSVFFSPVYCNPKTVFVIIILLTKRGKGQKGKRGPFLYVKGIVPLSHFMGKWKGKSRNLR